MTVFVKVLKGDTIQGELKLRNLDVLSNLDEKLTHLPLEEKRELATLIKEFNISFPDTPGRTTRCQCR